jgi:hypothetical protein
LSSWDYRNALHGLFCFVLGTEAWTQGRTPWAIPPDLFLWRFFFRYSLSNYFPKLTSNEYWALPPES